MHPTEWFYSFAGGRCGPVTEDQIRKLIVEKALDIDSTLLWKEGMMQWLILSEVIEFEPSCTLIKRLSVAETRSADIEILGKILEKKRVQPRSFLNRITNFWFTLRIAFVCILGAFIWAWLNQFITGSPYIPALLMPLATLIAAGHHSVGVSLTMRFLAGAISNLSYLFSLYLAYLTQHGAIVGESLLSASKINWPSSYFRYLFQTMSDLDKVALSTSFFLPFLFVGIFYKFVTHILRHESYITLD